MRKLELTSTRVLTLAWEGGQIEPCDYKDSTVKAFEYM